MLGIMALLTGWALLAPLLLLLLVRSGIVPYQEWMGAILGITASVPLLGFFTIAGLGLIALSVTILIKPQDTLEPPR